MTSKELEALDQMFATTEQRLSKSASRSLSSRASGASRTRASLMSVSNPAGNLVRLTLVMERVAGQTQEGDRFY